MIKQIIVIKSEYEKLKADNESMKKALTEIFKVSHLSPKINMLAYNALAAIGGDDES